MKEDLGVFYVRFLFLLQESGYTFSLCKYLKTYTNKCKLCKSAKYNHLYFSKYLGLPIIKFKLLYSSFSHELLITLSFLHCHMCNYHATFSVNFSGKLSFLFLLCLLQQGDVLVCLQTPNARLRGSWTAAPLAGFAGRCSLWGSCWFGGWCSILLVWFGFGGICLQSLLILEVKPLP